MFLQSLSSCHKMLHTVAVEAADEVAEVDEAEEAAADP